MEVSEKLQFIRQHLRLPQREMGRMFGVTHLTYHLWEKGGFSPRFDRKEKIEDLYKEILAEQKSEARSK